MSTKLKDNLEDVSRKMFAGGVSSAFAKTCAAPFDRVKILLQTRTTLEASGLMEGRKPYSGIFSTLARVPQEQGFFALWRGNIPNCVRIVPTYALRFTFMPSFQRIASYGSDPASPLSLQRQMVAGGLSGGATMLFTYPLDLLRTRLGADVRAHGHSRSSMVGVARLVQRTEGWAGFYKGIKISLIEIMPYMAISMGGYEYLKTHIAFGNAKDETGWLYIWSKLGAGWLSGLTGSLVMFPVDTVKRQMMLDGSELAGSKIRYDGSISRCITLAFRKHGLRGFYRGCLINALTSGPTAAITFVANDMIRAYLEKR